MLKNEQHGSLSTNSSAEIPANAEQLKYENDRLKLALAQRYDMIDDLLTPMNNRFYLTAQRMPRNGKLN